MYLAGYSAELAARLDISANPLTEFINRHIKIRPVVNNVGPMKGKECTEGHASTLVARLEVNHLNTPCLIWMVEHCCR